VGWLLAVLARVAVTVALTPFRSSLGLAGALLCVLLAVVASAVDGGISSAAATAITGFLAADFFFTVPYYSLRIDRAIDVVGLIVFATVAVTTGLLVDILTRPKPTALPARPPKPWRWARHPARDGRHPAAHRRPRRRGRVQAGRPGLRDNSGSGRPPARRTRRGAVPGRAHRRRDPGPGRQQAHRAGRAPAPRVRH